jgi:hypothetical protein
MNTLPIVCDCAQTWQDRLDKSYRLDINEGPPVQEAELQRVQTELQPLFGTESVMGTPILVVYGKYYVYAQLVCKIISDAGIEAEGHYMSDMVREPHVFVPKHKWREAKAILSQAGYFWK